MKRLLKTALLLTTLLLISCVSTATQESTGQYIDSSAITAKVKGGLVSQLGIASVTGIQVKTYKGVVQLSGFVNNYQDITKAINIAKGVEGVIAVENSLLVKGKLR